MTPDDLWKRYAAIWSLPAAQRDTELAACLADDATYCDPQGVIAGRAALSAYMGLFQAGVPGGRFQIVSALHHHDRSLAGWRLLGPDDSVLQVGTSFAVAAPDGRLQTITGFFDPSDAPAGP